MASFSPVITLNVGGYVYTTSLSTLTQFPESMLGAIFSGRFVVQKDGNGNYFIDRDGPLFQHVLAFLRNGVLELPKNFEKLNLLLKEAEYYQILPLIQAIKERAQQDPEFTEVLTVYGRRHGKKSFLKSLSGRLHSLREMFHSASTFADPFEVTAYDNQAGERYTQLTGKLTVKEYHKAPTVDFVLSIAQAHGFEVSTEPSVSFTDVEDVGNCYWVLRRP